MNMFQDDFYSTKPSKNRSGAGKLRALQVIAVVFIVLGAGVMLLIFQLSTKEQAIEVASTIPNLEVIPEVSESELQRNLNDLIVQAVEHVNPSIVSVISIRLNEDNEERETGTGSGVIFEYKEGRAKIVTNQHVIQQADQIDIVFLSGERRTATLIGSDVFSDLAVLEVESEEIEHVAVFGDSSLLKSGQTAIAIGNPLGLGFSHTTTVGVISSPLRTIPVSLGTGMGLEWELDVIQTDAAINQGNSGGALINIDGRVIGINSMKIAFFGVEGLGFAIPINTAKPIIASLIEHGKVKRALLGVSTMDVDQVEDWASLDLPEEIKNGVVVMGTSGPARQARLQADDIIVALDEVPVDNVLLLRKYLYEFKQVGETVVVHYYRKGKKMETVVTLGEMD